MIEFCEDGCNIQHKHHPRPVKVREMRQKRDDETQDAYLIACIRHERDQEWREWIKRVEIAFQGSTLDGRPTLLFLEGYPPPDREGDSDSLGNMEKEEHGEPTVCPTCGSFGRLDKTNAAQPAFPDWIWKLPNGEWECHECHLK